MPLLDLDVLVSTKTSAARLVFILILILGATAVVRIRKLRRTRLPPGPKGKLFTGVKHLLPRIEPWKTYAEWSETYQSQ